jgi:hypothetical protein
MLPATAPPRPDRALTIVAPNLAETDPDLARVVAAWPTLAEPMRRAVLALVATALAGKPPEAAE